MTAEVFYTEKYLFFKGQMFFQICIIKHSGYTCDRIYFLVLYRCLGPIFDCFCDDLACFFLECMFLRMQSKILPLKLSKKYWEILLKIDSNLFLLELLLLLFYKVVVWFLLLFLLLYELALSAYKALFELLFELMFERHWRMSYWELFDWNII